MVSACQQQHIRSMTDTISSNLYTQKQIKVSMRVCMCIYTVSHVMHTHTDTRKCGYNTHVQAYKSTPTHRDTCRLLCTCFVSGAKETEGLPVAWRRWWAELNMCFLAEIDRLLPNNNVFPANRHHGRLCFGNCISCFGPSACYFELSVLLAKHWNNFHKVWRCTFYNMP